MLAPAVDDALESMLQAARSEGSRLSRSDIVTALIWQARRTDGDALGVVVRTCRRELQAIDPGEAPDSTGRPGPRPYAARSDS